MSDPASWTHVAPWPKGANAPRRLHLEAEAAARGVIAKRLGLEAVASLSSDLEVRPWLDGLEATGRLTATVTRLCGITLDPFVEIIDEPVALRALPEGSPHFPETPAGEVTVDLEADDPPESHGPDGVDLGAFLVESLGVALNPFPRKPDAVFEPPPVEERLSPFSVLAGLDRSKRAEP